MSLNRTATSVRLKSDDGLYYAVALQDKGEEVVIPEADSETGDTGTSDPYVALVGSDDQVYRWSLETITQDGETFINHLIELSSDQNEPALVGLDLLFGSEWLRVKVELQETGDGLTPNLIVVNGEPWPITTSVKCGGSALYVRPDNLQAAYAERANQSTFASRSRTLARTITPSRLSTFERPNRKLATYVCQ